VKMPAYGYVSREDGTYARTVTFSARSPSGGGTQATETIVRSASGRLLRIERSNHARTKRALSLAARRRKGDA